jgi:hypothetical protein
MTGTFKNLALATVLLSFSISAHAAETNAVPPTDTPAQAGDRCADINKLAAAADENSARQLAGLINDSDPAVQACAMRAAAVSKNTFAADALLQNVKEYTDSVNGRGLYEENLKARLKAIKSIWTLGEIGDARAIQKVLSFFGDSDAVIKINMVVGAGKAKSKEADAFLYKVAGAATESNEVRAAAYEMLDERGLAVPTAQLSSVNSMEIGDIIYTGGVFGIPQGWIGDLEIGHAGLFGGVAVKNGRIVAVVYDCVPDNFKPYGGVRKIYSFKYFTHENMYPFFGNRVSAVRPTAAQRKLIIQAAVAKLGHHYSDTHISQKGPDVFDCVGYTEYAYEAAGLNPTPDDQETGWGWPLTPAEQFASTVSNTHIRQARQRLPSLNTAEAPSQSIITGNFGSLSGLLGSGTLEIPAAPAVTPAPVN